MNPLYSLKNITLKYPLVGEHSDNQFVLALDNLSLDIYENECLAIMGGNGSGKSSLAKLLAGLAGDFSGELHYRGTLIRDYNRDIFSDVAMILQEPQNQILMPTVREEIAFPLENRRLPPDTIALKVEKAARQFRLDKLLDKKTDRLSGGQITALALATALATEPKMVILDEPDSHLDNESRATLLDFISGQRGKITIVLISQFPETAADADRCLILESGRRLFLGSAGRLFGDSELKKKSRLFPVIPTKRTGGDAHAIDKTPVSNAEPILQLKDVSFSYDKNNPLLKNIDLEIYPNEKIGMFGVSGSGKSTLALIMAGLLKPDRGWVLAKNIPISDMSTKQLRMLVAVSMQFPERAFVGHTVAEDIAFGPINLGYDNIENLVNRNIERFGLTGLADRHPFTLSGGQKRRAALAGITAMGTDIVIFDEPTAAMDPQTSADFIDELITDNEHTFIIISHDRLLLNTVCNRLIELKDGHIYKCDTN